LFYLAGLRVLGHSENTQIATLAHLVLDVGAATPYRRQRIRILARERRDIMKRMEETGLIMPLPPILEDTHPYDIDPVAAWHEWVEFARTCDDE
jgi:sugar phosphate isomerase/epimerase